MEFKKILIVNTFGIGDVLFTIPLIRNIRERYPTAFIAYLGNARTAPFLENDKDIGQVFVYERDEYKAVYDQSKIKFYKKMKEALKELKEYHFECVFDLSLQASTSIFMKMAGIKTRIGYNFKNRSPFLTNKIPLKGYRNKHVVEYYLDLLKEVDIDVVHRSLELTITDQDEKEACDLLQNNGVNGNKSIVTIVPGGGASWGVDADFKRWAPENYSKLADKIIEKFGSQIILLGDQKEADLCSKVAENMTNSALNLAGKTSIGQMAAIFKKSSLALLNDGGPLHVAVAVGTKTVSIFGPVDETVYGPYPADNHRVVTKKIACRPCYHKFRRADCDHISCLRTIEVDEVLERVEELL